jgi:transposase
VAIKGAKMGQKSGPTKEPAEQVVKEIRRATRRQFSAEEKIRIVLAGLRGEDSIAEQCRREVIVQNLYYRWLKEFLEADKKRLAGDTARAATSDEVRDLRREAGGFTRMETGRIGTTIADLLVLVPLGRTDYSLQHRIRSESPDGRRNAGNLRSGGSHLVVSLRRRLASPRLIIGRRAFVWDMPAWGPGSAHEAELEAVVGAPLMLIA